MKLIFFGFLNFSQKLTNQIVIISPKRLEIFGAVIKSPFSPKGFSFDNNQNLCRKEPYPKKNPMALIFFLKIIY